LQSGVENLGGLGIEPTILGLSFQSGALDHSRTQRFRVQSQAWANLQYSSHDFWVIGVAEVDWKKIDKATSSRLKSSNILDKRDFHD